nr:hypothetical protein [Rhizobium sp. Pop5]
MTFFSGINSHLGEKFRLDLKGKGLYRVELLSSFSIEGAVEGAGHSILRQRLARRQPVGRGRFMIFCIRSREQLPEVGFEDCLVDHDSTCCLVRARYISRRVPVWRKEREIREIFLHLSAFKREIFMPLPNAIMNCENPIPIILSQTIMLYNFG